MCQCSVVKHTSVFVPRTGINYYKIGMYGEQCNEKWMCGVAQTKVSIPSIAGIYYASSGDHG